jgi:transketolase
LFEKASQQYQNAVLPTQVKTRLAVEMGVGLGWKKWVGDEGEVISIETFGASAPYQKLLEEYGFSVANVIAKAKKLLKKKR